MDFVGKNAVVTGGASGIGRAIARALAAEGAAIAIADVMEENAARVVDEIRADGGQAIAIACDVSDRGSVGAMRERVEKALGPVALLVANAGVTSFEELTDMSDNEVDWVIDVSLYGVVHCVQAFAPGMIAAGSGHILATASVAALVAPYMGEHAPYIAAKAGIIGFMMSLRPDLAKHGVGATVLCPSAVESNIAASPHYRTARYGGPQDAGVTLPTKLDGRMTIDWRPAEEVAEMVLDGIRANRPVILTDPRHRAPFEQGYVAQMLEAFEEAAAFDRARGR